MIKIRTGSIALHCVQIYQDLCYISETNSVDPLPLLLCFRGEIAVILNSSQKKALA